MQQTDPPKESRFLFPRWANYLLPALALMGIGAATYLPALVGLGFSAKTLSVGYAPEQPVAFSHAVHAGNLGIDCRYCHTSVESAAFAAIPPTQTCMNCHAKVLPDSAKIQPVRESFLTGKPIEWVKVHNLADYVYFNHSAHVTRGVSCVSCHGRVDQMERVTQVQPMSMSWCLDCHRKPETALRPADKVTDLAWQAPDGDQLKIGLELKEKLNIHDPAYMTSCSTCHR